MGPAIPECVARMTPAFHLAPLRTSWSVRGESWSLKHTANLAMFREYCAEYTEPVATMALMISQNQPGHTADNEHFGIHRKTLLNHPLVTQIVREAKPPAPKAAGTPPR